MSSHLQVDPESLVGVGLLPTTGDELCKRFQIPLWLPASSVPPRGEESARSASQGDNQPFVGALLRLGQSMDYVIFCHFLNMLGGYS